MFLFLLLLFTIMFFLGAAISLISMAKYTTYAETEGEIVDYLKCNPDEEDPLQEGTKGKESAVVISYRVGGKTYHLSTNIKSNSNEDAVTPVKVLYDPYFPGESILKEGTPSLGSSLIVISIICFMFLFFFW